VTHVPRPAAARPVTRLDATGEAKADLLSSCRRRDLKRRAIEVFLEVSNSPKKEPAMTHQDECPAINDLMTLLIEHGPEALVIASLR